MSHIIAIVLHEYLKEKLIIRGTMAKLALNLCKWIFSFLGLLPLRLKFDESSGKFKGFVCLTAKMRIVLQIEAFKGFPSLFKTF